MDKSINIFQPTKTKLLTGINLIEASAGTGKTYAIAMLIIRFVVEQNLDIKQILVVTFTKAATEELKDRIRNRLTETRLAVIDNQNSSDETLSQWLNNLDIEPELIIQRLNNALMDIDQAGIFTIHGFCQRTLTEHALESGQLFDAELTGDISSIEQNCSDDFWRQHIYSRSAWEASILIAQHHTPDELLGSVASIASDTRVFPEFEDLDQLLAEFKQLIKTCRSELIFSINLLAEKCAEGKFKKSFTDYVNQHSQNLIDWLTENSNTLPEFSIFTEQGLLAALNGHQFKTSKTNPLSAEEQKQNYIDCLQINSKSFEQIDSAIKNMSLHFRRALLQSLRDNVNKKLQQLNVLSFDTLITRLANALTGKKAQTLSKEIQQRYQLALIDEFQDTDLNQWTIFSTLFNSAEHYLYLIGDPKQAIYKFRGADITTYFSAQKQAQHCFTLSHNWRSHPQLVEAINTLFSRNNAFYSEALNFNPVNAALSSDHGALVRESEELAPLVLWQLDKNEAPYWWTSGKAASEIHTAVVNEIIDLLSSDVCIKSKQTLNIQPRDIAILVRTNPQAKQFQQTLNQVGITAVINNKESVFSSTEAVDLYQLLLAIAQPGNNTLLKQALTLDWFNMNGQQLLQTLNNEVSMDSWVSRFQAYQLDWQNKGLMVMLRGLIEKEKIYLHLTRNFLAERRITNLQHIIELVQQATIDEHLGINKTLDWLQHNITQANSNNSLSDQQLRLESDEDAIQIITMHSAKGLEYPVVFCPFLWQRGDRISKEKQVVKCHVNNEMIADLGSEKFEQHRSIALEEELAEDIRVFYVAVTRAKYRCYIHWADVRTKDKTNNSAMAYLLDFSATTDFAAQQTKLQNFSRNQLKVFEYRLLKAEQKELSSYRPVVSASTLTFKQKQRSHYSHSQMTSYTALSSLSIDDTAELPADKAREPQSLKQTETNSTELPKGIATGNVIHDLLENISFKTLAENNDISLLRDKSCLRYNLKTEAPEQIDLLLKNTVTTVLETKNCRFSLQQLNEQQCLKEMPFYLPMKRMNVSQINHILKDCPSYQPLSKKTMSGYLTGFIDLICEFNGQYYILDYKSNHLDTYDQGSLINAMREHNYGLQYWIYTLVLHQYLQNKLPDYNYEQHIGGVKYLFVRGMNDNQANSGVYQTKPDQIKIEQLAKLFI